MPNATKLRETVDVIDQNRHRWNQSRWATGAVNPNATTWQECGTAFCIAGWRCVLDGLRPAVAEMPNWADSPVAASGSFYRLDNPHGRIWPSRHARQEFELNCHEADALFYFETTDIEALRQRVEEIIAGEWSQCDDDCDCGLLE